MERKIPKIGSEDFKQLPWKEQVEIVKLKITDPDKYNRDVCGQITDKQLLKLMDELAFLLEEAAREYPKTDNKPITIKHHWVACSGWIDFKKYAETFKKYKIDHRWFFKTLLLKVPLLIFPIEDEASKVLLDNLYASYPEKDVGFRFIKAKTFVDTAKPELDDMNSRWIREILSISAEVYASIETLYSLRKSHERQNYSALNDNKVSNWYVNGELLLCWSKHKRQGKIYSCPLIPKQVFVDGFSIKDWHYLV